MKNGNVFSIEIFRERLSELMEEIGYKQKELADAVGVSDKTVGHWFHGIAKGTIYKDSIPSIENLFELSKVLDVSVDYLIGRDDNRHFGNKEIVEATGLSEHTIEVLRFLKSKSGKIDGGMAHGPNTDTYSWKNVEMINYIFEDGFKSIKNKKEKNRPLPTVLTRMYDYIFSGELQYIHSEEERDVLFGIRKKDGFDYDRIMFYNSLTETTMYVNANEMIKSILLDNIQNYLKGEADKHEKEVSE